MMASSSWKQHSMSFKGACVLLFMVDALKKHFLAILLSDAGALLPTAESAGQDLMDVAGGQQEMEWVFWNIKRRNR